MASQRFCPLTGQRVKESRLQKTDKVRLLAAFAVLLLLSVGFFGYRHFTAANTDATTNPPAAPVGPTAARPMPQPATGVTGGTATGAAGSEPQTGGDPAGADSATGSPDPHPGPGGANVPRAAGGTGGVPEQNGSPNSAASPPETASYAFTDGTPTSSSSEAPYGPQGAFDNNPATFWHADEADHTPWIKVRYPDRRRVTRIGMIVGRTGSWFKKNGRVQDVVLRFSNGEKQLLQFNDVPQMQYRDLKPPVLTDSVQFTIKSVYPGATPHITIPEIEVSGVDP